MKEVIWWHWWKTMWEIVVILYKYIEDNPLCMGVQWGMETEYKFIGISEEKLSEGRKKTTCPKGKDLNMEMKEIVRKIKLTGEWLKILIIFLFNINFFEISEFINIRETINLRIIY